MSHSPAVDPFSPAYLMLQALRERQVSASELLAMYTERKTLHNPALNAIVIDNHAEATGIATDADLAYTRGAPVGALAGLPITIKDCIETRGLPTTSGVPARFAMPAAHDAPIAG